MQRTMTALELVRELFARGRAKCSTGNYYGLLMTLAYAQYAVETKEKAAIAEVLEVLKGYPDGFGSAQCNFENYKFGGGAKAYFILEGLLESEKEGLRAFADKTLAAPADRAGIVCLPQFPEKEMVWIDSVYAITPFMLYAGLALHEERYIEFAFTQCEKMYTLFLDTENGLLHQARGFMADRHAISHDHWGRGNGWCYLGLTELVKHLPKVSPYREKAVEMFKALSAALLPHQTHLGLWRQEIPCDLSWVESSGTALFAYGYGTGLRLGILDKNMYTIPFQEAIGGLARHGIGADGSTRLCSGGCLCPGKGERKGTVSAYLTDIFSYHDEGHSFGPFMLAMLEAHRNGINEVTIGK